MTKRAIAYARISSKKEDWQARLESQIDVCTQYAIHNGYEIVDSISEIPGISGKTTDRPELNKVLFRTDFDVLICRDLDRLSRDTYALGFFERALRGNNITIEFVNQTFDDTPSGELHKDMVSSFSKFERKMIAQRLRMGRYRSIKAGNVYCRMAPYGYDKAVVDGKKTLIINEQESRVVKMIFDWCLQGESTYQIAEKLTSLKIPTRYDRGDITSHKQRAKNEWVSPSILHILHSKSIGLGEWSYTFADTGEMLIVKVPAIVDKQTYYAVQKKLLENKTHSKPVKPKRYLIAGLGECTACGYKMQSTTKIVGKYEYGYYRCTADIENKIAASPNCPKKYFPVKKIDAIVWQTTKDIMSKPRELYAKLIKKLNSQDESPELKRLKVLDSQIADKKTELENCLNELVITSGEYSKEFLRKKRDDLEQELGKLNGERDILTAIIENSPLLDEKRIDSIVALATTLEHKLERITDFNDKRKIIELLRVQVFFGQLDNGYLMKIQCIVSEETLQFDENLSLVNKSVYQHIQERQKPIVLEIGYILDVKCNIIEIAA